MRIKQIAAITGLTGAVILAGSTFITTAKADGDNNGNTKCVGNSDHEGNQQDQGTTKSGDVDTSDCSHDNIVGLGASCIDGVFLVYADIENPNPVTETISLVSQSGASFPGLPLDLGKNTDTQLTASLSLGQTGIVSLTIHGVWSDGAENNDSGSINIDDFDGCVTSGPPSPTPSASSTPLPTSTPTASPTPDNTPTPTPSQSPTGIVTFKPIQASPTPMVTGMASSTSTTRILIPSSLGDEGGGAGANN